VSDVWLDEVEAAAARRRATLDRIKKATKSWTVRAVAPAETALIEARSPGPSPSVLAVIRERYAARARYILAILIPLALFAAGFGWSVHDRPGDWILAGLMGALVVLVTMAVGLFLGLARIALLGLWAEATASDRGRS